MAHSPDPPTYWIPPDARDEVRFVSVEENLVVVVWEGPGFEGVRQIIDIIISWRDIVVIRIRIRIRRGVMLSLFFRA